MTRVAQDLFRLVKNLSCKSACHSKICNDDTIFGVFTPCLKELPALKTFQQTERVLLFIVKTWESGHTLCKQVTDVKSNMLIALL